VLGATNCTDLACLRTVPERAIIRANEVLVNTHGSGGGGVYGPSLGFGFVPGDEATPDMPEAMFRKGKYHKELKRILVGNMANEVSTHDLLDSRRF